MRSQIQWVTLTVAVLSLCACPGKESASAASLSSGQALATAAVGGCSVTQEVNGATIRCGNASAFISNGSNGIAGVSGSQGLAGPAGAYGATGPTGERGFQGPPGPGAASEFWLVKLDGTPIAQIVSREGPWFSVWDDIDGMLIDYRGANANGDLKFQGSDMQGVSLYYTTANCSDVPHSSAERAVDLGAVPNTGFLINNSLYKVEAIWDSIVPVARTFQEFNGTLHTCEAYVGANRSYPRVTLIPAPAVPTTLPIGSFKIEKR